MVTRSEGLRANTNLVEEGGVSKSDIVDPGTIGLLTPAFTPLVPLPSQETSKQDDLIQNPDTIWGDSGTKECLLGYTVLVMLKYLDYPSLMQMDDDSDHFLTAHPFVS